ncbi:MAG: RagB/SusD family nutrient uptake outer membrane protein [Bacteroidota bacterium]|nr:RagB/SusD family nutrient uptake outer membrane protein [Bacteroidota bacterium]
MNKYIKYSHIKSLIIVFIAFFFMGCQKDFLDKNPLDQISSPTFWKTQNDADMALAGCYSRLNCNTFNYSGNMSLDIMAGDACEGAQSLGSSSTGEFALGQMFATSGGILYNVYSDCYNGIATCNTFLANIDHVSIPDAVKTEYKGEVLFLRALFYFTLSDFYGGVPLYTAPTVTVADAEIKQSSKDSVVAQVLADLQVAIANLPNTAYDGHAVKGSALALESRVLLYKQDWAGAAAAAQQVMTDGIFQLSGDYKNLFLAAGQDKNPEIMFSTRYLNPDNSIDQDIEVEWWGLWNPRQELVDAFECTDGLPITQSPLYNPANWKLNRDPRMLLTLKAFADPAVKASGEVVPYAYNGNSITGYEPTKGANVEALPVDYSTKSEQDWILIRYAEVLLNFAEATNEVSGATTAVYDAINQVRARPGINMPPIPAGLTQDDMRKRIWNERRVEFGLEGRRYSDIRRWKLAETYLNSLVLPGSGTQYVFDPAKNYLWPFPQSEIDINKNLVQNPGY